MDEHISHGRKSQSQPKADIELYLATPAVMGEGMTAEDWDRELDRMFKGSLLTRDFVNGSISPADFEDGLADLGHNPHILAELWEEGTSLLY